jgi:hypothetical protein
MSRKINIFNYGVEVLLECRPKQDDFGDGVA